jgi:hypothetical protein
MPKRPAHDGLTKDQSEFLDWLIDPDQTRLPKTQKEYASEHHCSIRTLSEWKKRSDFREAWDRRLSDINISPDRIQAVVNSMWAQACRGNVKAAELYLKYIDRFRDVREVITTTSVEDLSDEELDEAYQGFIESAVEARQAAAGPDDE